MDASRAKEQKENFDTHIYIVFFFNFFLYMNVCTLHWNNGLCHSTRLWSPNRSSTKLVWHCKDTQTPFWTWERSSQIQLGDHLQNQVLCKACSTRLRLSTESVMLCQAKICAWRVNKFQQIISSFFAPWTCATKDILQIQSVLLHLDSNKMITKETALS